MDIGYGRNSKFVDVKLVKKHMWDVVSQDHTAKEAAGKREASSFQDAVLRTVLRLPEAAMDNLSVAVCFVCQLHLCNETGLELEVGDNNLSVVGKE